MQTKQSQKSPLIWKKLENNIFITHFPSINREAVGTNSQIYVRKFEALKSDSNKKMTVFLLHDIGQHHGRFQQFIDWTRTSNPGVSFVAMDFVGHGLSSGTRGHFEKFDDLTNDLDHLLSNMEKDSSENEQWLILGHGLGALVALDLLNRFQSPRSSSIDGLILSNFILKFNSKFLNIEQRFMSQYSGFIKLISHSRPYRLISGQQVLNCPLAILQHEQDPLIVHRPTLNSIREIQKKVLDIYHDSYFLVKPLMLLNSEIGEMPQGRGIGQFSKGIKKDLVTEKKYSLMKHDLYNELERVSVFEDIKDWMRLYEN